MAITRYSTFDKTVNNIAERNAITNKVNHMTVVVLDAIADINVGTGKAVYRWDASDNSWIVVSTGNNTVQFITEDLLIQNGSVQLQHFPISNSVWNGLIYSNNTIIGYLNNTAVVSLGVISNIDPVFEGKTLKITYAYGVLAQQIIEVIEDKVSDILNNDLKTVKGESLVGDGDISYTSSDIKTLYEENSNKILNSVDNLTFNTNLSSQTSVPGKLSWNPDESTLDLGLNGAILQIGQEFLARVRNNTSSTIINGTPVMAVGSLGNSGRILVEPFNGLQESAERIIGILTEDVSAGGDGFATIFGKIRNINTTGSLYGESWSDGQILYTKPSSSGALTKITPTDSQIDMSVAFVVHAHTNGTLFVRVTGFDKNHFKPWVNNLISLLTPNIGTSEYQLFCKRGSKQVFGIEVDFGSLPDNATKEVNFSFNSLYTYWLDCQNSYCFNSDEVLPVPYSGNVGENITIFLDKTNNKIKITTGIDRTNFSAKVVILYTK